MVLNVLMVAEKPSLAQSLAQFLAQGPIKSRKGAGLPVHEYNGSFKGRPANFKFTSVAGHVMTCDFPAQYNNWDRVDPVELFTAPTQKKEANPNMHMPKFLQREAKNCDYLVLWLDCDKEGENICFEVMDSVSSVMQISLYNPQTVYRARFSALTANDIRRSFQELVRPNELESLSVEARMEIDLRIGCAFTRFQTRFFHGKYGDLDSSVISYGPCQTPTLGFCVDRHDKIQSFQPEPYWVLIVKVRPCTADVAAELTLDWAKEREFKKPVANAALSEVKSHGRAKVTDISFKDKTKPRPTGLNTVELLRVCSSALGIGPHTAMIVAERLYTQGYISYPRTETTAYPKSFDFYSLINMFSSHPDVGRDVHELLRTGINQPKGGIDVGDHPPITPCRSATSQEIPDRDGWRVYDYVMRHFLGSICGDLKYKQTTITFTIGREIFTKTGAVVTNPGFSKFMTWISIAEGYLSSSIKIGDEFSITEAKIVEKKTSPPDYLTESDLISLMEKHGIGTDASIPTHINNICTRNYVTIESGRRLVPTQLGIILVHGYQKIDNDLILPTRRAALERQLDSIVKGQHDYKTVLRDTIRDYHQKFDFFVSNIAAMDELFEVCFTSLAETGKPMSRCGRCNRYMKMIVAKPQRLYCLSCKETFSVPQRGIIKLFKEIKCPIDGFEILYMQSDRNERSYPFCPNCYNNPPFENMKKAVGCNDCLHEKCEHSMISNAIRQCTSCTYNGRLVLDTGSGPKKYQVACNRCHCTYQGLDKATRVKVKISDQCEKCKAKLVFAEFKPDTHKILGDKTKLIECVFCGPTLSRLLHLRGGHRKGGDGEGEEQEGGGDSRFRGRGGPRRGRGHSGRGGPAGRGEPEANRNPFMVDNKGPDGWDDDDPERPGGFRRGRGRGGFRGSRGARGPRGGSSRGGSSAGARGRGRGGGPRF